MSKIVVGTTDKTAATTPDFTVDNHGSLCILWPKTPEAQAWADEHIGDDETQYWGKNGIVIEPRYLQDIITGAEENGFSVQL